MRENVYAVNTPVGAVAGARRRQTGGPQAVRAPGRQPGSAGQRRPVAQPGSAGQRRPVAGREWSRLVVLGILLSLAVVATDRMAAPVPDAVVHRLSGPDVQRLPAVVAGVSPGRLAALPWPATGGGAVGLAGVGLVAAGGDSNAVPIASVTKMMTADIVLADHPLAGRSGGPEIRMTQQDVDINYEDELRDESNVPVSDGEKLTERQVLQGLLVHSANNLADTLARWDGGSVPAFVARMNREAASLGLTNTRFADPSGYDPGSVSTPGDLVRLASVCMGNPAFRSIVDEPSVTLPVAGLVQNYVSAIGRDGVVGIKSGFTNWSQGVVVLAAVRNAGGLPVTVLAAVTGQGGIDPLGSAQDVALRLINALTPLLSEDTIVHQGDEYGQIRVPWQRGGVPVTTAKGISLASWPGAVPSISVKLNVHRLRCGTLDSGQRIGTVTGAIGGSGASVPLIVRSAVPCPAIRWRLAHD